MTLIKYPPNKQLKIMDLVEFTTDRLDVRHNQPAQIELTVTPGRTGKFTLFLQVLGSKCFFLTERGLVKTISKEFPIEGIMQPQACIMDFVLVAQEGSFPTLTNLRARTDRPANTNELDVNILESVV